MQATELQFTESESRNISNHDGLAYFSRLVIPDLRFLAFEMKQPLK